MRHEMWNAALLVRLVDAYTMLALRFLSRTSATESVVPTEGRSRRALKSDITPEGFEARRLKGSRDALTEWSDRLRAAIKTALVTPRRIEGVYVIQDRNGQPITKTAFDSAWQRLKVKIEAAGVEAFNFHDLKAKGVSDFEGDKRVAATARLRWWLCMTAKSRR